MVEAIHLLRIGAHPFGDSFRGDKTIRALIIVGWYEAVRLGFGIIGHAAASLSIGVERA